MSSIVKETPYTNIFIYKIIDTSIKVKPVIDNLCWFCNMKCSTFVKICENCEYDNYVKKRKKKKNEE